MTDAAAEAAMDAIAEALGTEADEADGGAGVIAARRMEAEQEAALDLVTRHVGGEKLDRDDVINALDTLAAPLGQMLTEDEDGGDWDGEGWLSCDPHSLETAASYARRGAHDDALHHLERALPDGYGDIAARLADHLRSRK